jgi:hypothetical protein
MISTLGLIYYCFNKDKTA